MALTSVVTVKTVAWWWGRARMVVIDVQRVVFHCSERIQIAYYL